MSPPVIDTQLWGMIHHDRVRAPYILCHVSMKNTVGLGVSGHAPGGKTAIFITPLIFQDTMRTLISLSGQLQSNNQNNAGKTMEIKCTVVIDVACIFDYTNRWFPPKNPRGHGVASSSGGVVFFVVKMRIRSLKKNYIHCNMFAV